MADAALLHILLLLLCATGSTIGTRCYVCGGLSSLAETCIDDYPADMRTDDIMDCNEVFGHTVGCTKSKYSDTEGRQIVKRACAPEVGMNAENECKYTEVSGNKVYFCHCQDDYCNSATTTTSTKFILITVSALITAYQWVIN